MYGGGDDSGIDWVYAGMGDEYELSDEAVSFEPDTSWYDEHEDDSSYILDNAEDLFGFAELVNEKSINFKDKTITLGDNIS